MALPSSDERATLSALPREAISHNALWAMLVRCRAARDAMLAGMSPEESDRVRFAVAPSPLLGARKRLESLEARIAALESDYPVSLVRAEVAMGRGATPDERMRGFGSPFPDGALAESRPWDTVYRPPGVRWAPRPVPPGAWRTLGDRVRAVADATRVEEGTGRQSAEAALAEVRAAWQSAARERRETTDPERRAALDAAMAVLAAEGRLLANRNGEKPTETGCHGTISGGGGTHGTPPNDRGSTWL